MRVAALMLFGLILGPVFADGRAAAAVPATRLVYERDTAVSECPDRGVFEDAVRARLGREPFRQDGERQLLVRLQRDADGGFAGVLTVTDRAEGAPATRRLTVPGDCDELLEQIAFTTAVVLDPLAAFSAPVEPAAPPPAAPSLALPAVSRAAPPVTVPSASASWRLGGGLGMLAGPGAIHTLWPQARLVLERAARSSFLSASVSASSITDTGSPASRTTPVITTLALCWLVWAQRFAVCPEVLGGVVRGTDPGYVSYVPVGGGGLRVVSTVSSRDPSSRLRLFAAVDGAFAGAQFNVHQAWDTPGWFGVLGMDVLVDLP